MHRIPAFLLLAFFSAGASAETLWKGTNTHSVVAGSGDVLKPDGAAVTLSAESTGTDTFVGTITSLDAAEFRGKEARLAATLLVKDGEGAALLWLRADGPKGRLAFANTAAQPVHAADGPQQREVLLYIPAETTHLRLGVTLGSAGHVEVKHLTHTSQAAVTSGVSAFDVVEHALSTMRDRALNADKVDWSAQQKALLTPDLAEAPAQEAYARIQQVVTALGDRHTHLQRPAQAATHRETAVASRPIEGRQLQDIGYVRVPGLRGIDKKASEAFTAQLCEQVERLAPTSSKGWVVDLREDNGGNMRPMINGLHSLLGTADIGAFRYREGQLKQWRSRPSKACSTDLSRSPVAVLVGPRTASSGEAVAVAFRARPETRFFGQPTAGLSTGNQTFPLPDGGNLLLTTSVFLDRSGEAYPQGITPENVVSSDQDAISAAEAWLRSLAP